ncbi:hypothetical protein LL969_13050 [Xanthomonas campestris pv. phormiicola]|nr:hypothetical protein [Xanthomonas campestris pv. phormiicola]
MKPQRPLPSASSSPLRPGQQALFDLPEIPSPRVRPVPGWMSRRLQTVVAVLARSRPSRCDRRD